MTDAQIEAAARAAFTFNELAMASRHNDPKVDTVVYRALTWDQAHQQDQQRYRGAQRAALGAVDSMSSVRQELEEGLREAVALHERVMTLLSTLSTGEEAH